MDIKVKDKVNQRHVGRNLQRIRVYLGMKQEALASDLGVSQQEISKIEKQDEIEDGLLTKIAEVLGISTDVIKDFDVEKAICNINNYKDATISPGAIATVYAHNQQINPLEKVVELYERLLKSEQEKIEILRECTGKYTSAKSHHFTGKRMDRENYTSPKTISQSVVVRFVAKSGFYQILFFISFLDCLFGECIVTFSTVA